MLDEHHDAHAFWADADATGRGAEAFAPAAGGAVTGASTTSLRIAALLADARRSLDHDPDTTRHCLEQLSAILMPTLANAPPADAILPGVIAPPNVQAKGGLASWQVRRVTDHIARQLEKPINTHELATVARLSTGHFCRAFKVTMGETPHAYIIRQRLRRAQTLMIGTRDTLSQIAYACGLSDQAHLTRLFRRVIGTTPMSWRRYSQNAG